MEVGFREPALHVIAPQRRNIDCHGAFFGHALLCPKIKSAKPEKGRASQLFSAIGQGAIPAFSSCVTILLRSLLVVTVLALAGCKFPHPPPVPGPIQPPSPPNTHE